MTHISMYVDGWNFYWSLVDANIKPYGWCDFPLLAKQQTYLPDAQVTVKYFTSADTPHKEKIEDRQKTIWWRALELIGCKIITGEFRSTHEEVEEQIRMSTKTWREKQTDIALACHMLADCIGICPDDQPGQFRWTPGYDRAVLLTQDLDFLPLVKTLANAPFDRPVLLLPPSGERAQENAHRAWSQYLYERNVVVKQLRQVDLAKALLPRVVQGEVVCHHSWMCREEHEARVAARSRTRRSPGSS